MSSPIIELADIDPRMPQARLRDDNRHLPAGAIMAAMALPASVRRDTPYILAREYSPAEWATVSTRYRYRADAAEAVSVLNLWRTDSRQFVLVDARPTDSEIEAETA